MDKQDSLTKQTHREKINRPKNSGHYIYIYIYIYIYERERARERERGYVSIDR
jgi:hypothetical protein